MIRLAIFASGKGSNADAICGYFNNHSTIKVSCILSDRKSAGVFGVALKHQVPSIYLSKEELQFPEKIIALLRLHDVGFIILAGYLKLMPVEIITAFKNKIINIHPALLPKYGGKGMFGMHVHQAVCEAQEVETGITIHQVNEEYDKGAIIFQTKVALLTTDTPQTIAAKIHDLEMKNFARVIEEWVMKEDKKIFS